MIPPPMLILAVVLAFIGSGFYWHAKGANGMDAQWRARITADNLKASQEARAKEQMWQGVVNETAKNYETQMAGVRRTLDAALDGLRDRPERPAGVSAAARADCAGGTGAELSRPDAEFLVREAARADTLRAALAACYAYADTVRR